MSPHDWASDPSLRPWAHPHPGDQEPDVGRTHDTGHGDTGIGDTGHDEVSVPVSVPAGGGVDIAGAPAADTGPQSWAQNQALTPWFDSPPPGSPVPVSPAPVSPVVSAPAVVLGPSPTVPADPAPLADVPAAAALIRHAVVPDSAGTEQGHGWAGPAAPPVAPRRAPAPHEVAVTQLAESAHPAAARAGSALWVPTARRRRATSPVSGGAEPVTAAATLHLPAPPAPEAAPRPTGAGGPRPSLEAGAPAAPGTFSGAAGAPDETAAGGPGGATVAGAGSLTEETMVPRRGEPAGTGWRGALYVASGGVLRVGPGAAQRRRAEWVARIRAELPAWHTVTVASIKGGIGKTTLAALLGLTLAEYRGDRVVALDANPDAGTLADRLLGRPARRTVRDLVAECDSVATTTDMARFTATAGRLHVLASDQDPAASEAFSKRDYDRVLGLLKRFYNIVITDSGTGLIHSAMGGALESTRTLVIAGAPTVDGGSRASKTLDWLHAHGFDELAADAVVVLSQDRSSREVDRDAIAAHFRQRCRAVVELPADPHLLTGGQIVFDRLRPRTRDAALQIAAHVADQFGWDWPEAPTVPTPSGPTSSGHHPRHHSPLSFPRSTVTTRTHRES